MEMTTFYRLHSSTWNTPEMDDEVKLIACKNWLCAECGSIKLAPCSIDVQVNNHRFDKPINFISDTRIGVIFDDLLALLDPVAVSKQLHLGRLYGPDGSEIVGWHTFRGQYRVVIRASTNAGYRNCDTCGDIIYSGQGKKYLFPAPPAGIDIFESDYADLVVSERLFKGIDIKKWRKFHGERVRVVTIAEDGCDELRMKTFKRTIKSKH